MDVYEEFSTVTEEGSTTSKIDQDDDIMKTTIILGRAVPTTPPSHAQDDTATAQDGLVVTVIK